MNKPASAPAAALQEASRLASQGRLPQAAQLLRQHLQAQPGDALAWQMLGLMHLMSSQWPDAASALEQSAALNGQDARTWAMLGVACSQQGRVQQAISHFDAAVALAPADAALWCDRGRALHAAQRLEEALASADRALSLNPAQPAAWLLRGNTLRDLRRLPEAVQSLQQAARLAPADALHWHALAAALEDGRQFENALACARRGLAVAPRHSGLWVSRGNAEMALDQPQPAAASYEQACQCDPGNADAWVGRSRALFKLGEDEQALDCLEKGVALDDKPPFLAELMRYRQKQARWDDLPALWARVLAQLDEHNAYSMAFPMLAHPGATGADLLRSARACMAAERAKLPRPLPARPKPPEPVPAPAAGRPLRVGYLSGDLRDHAVSYLLAGVFEAHDRSAFRVIGIDACAKAVSDTPMRQRVLAAFDESIALGRCTPEEAASRIRALRLDVLIDLMGATGDGQAGVPLLRPAPLQVAWLGFPGTSGMDEIDYILADRHVAPPGSEGEFSECVVRLPDTFQPNDSQRAISSAVPTRASQGLPENGFVFCCHNNTYKVLPGMFDIWMRLLHRVPGSVLWLVNDGEHVRANLRAQAARRGIDGGRLVFAERCAYGDYLARYRLADLFLDTLPFNAGTTASDALWAGLPVLTQTGRSFAGRMAASLLHAVGLPELVTQTADEYEALALRLATHAQELAALRQRLNQQGRASALFDTARLTRHLEQALLTMCQRQQQGLPPQGFDVPALPAA